jgi:hypothetical protein
MLFQRGQRDVQPLRFFFDLARAGHAEDVAQLASLHQASAMQRTAKMTVLPWPKPTTMHDSTKSIAYQAACCLSCEMSTFTLSAP